MKYLVFMSLFLIGTVSANNVLEWWCADGNITTKNYIHICVNEYQYQLCVRLSGANILLNEIRSCPYKQVCQTTGATPCGSIPLPTTTTTTSTTSTTSTTTTTTTTTTERYADCDAARRDLIKTCHDYVYCTRTLHGKLDFYNQDNGCVGDRKYVDETGLCRNLEKGYSCEVNDGIKSLNYKKSHWWSVFSG